MYLTHSVTGNITTTTMDPDDIPSSDSSQSNIALIISILYLLALIMSYNIIKLAVRFYKHCTHAEDPVPPPPPVPPNSEVETWSDCYHAQMVGAYLGLTYGSATTEPPPSYDEATRQSCPANAIVP
jgi:hypothetical protein